MTATTPEAATAAEAVVGEQPYDYRRRELVEPDWRRLPGWRDVTGEEWASVQWQRAHCVKNIKQLRALMGDLLEDRFYADLERDQAERATMSMLVPPQMMNTMVPAGPEDGRSWTEAFYADPVRRYMIPVLSDRRTDWPSHPYASRDSLHEAEMWAVEGLTHRYPTKVLAEVLPTCPQYCGHCTRMDLVGNPTPSITKHKFGLKPVDRLDAMIDYLKRTPGVRDVVVSGGDVAIMPWPRLESDTHIMSAGSARPLEDAFRIAGLDLVQWLAAEYGLDQLDAYQLITQAIEAPLANVCDPNYTSVVKMPKQYLPAADPMQGAHARLRELARAYRGTAR